MARLHIKSISWYWCAHTLFLASVPALWDWRIPNPEECVLLVVVAILGVSGQFCNIRSYRLGEATAMAPFGYLRLIFAGFFGYILFAERPDLWMWIGAGIIIASTLYIAIREARRKEAPVTKE